ncbi:MAG: phosphoenolpyruvate carboxykinase (ATP) [Cyclobacteriaceae bacterium]|nr:phosphoenolpyruvate carboxykinase (ATP) [Cyclobacteriaceae bacterium]
MVNTGWSGGAYGVGSSMRQRYTGAMIAAALIGELDQVEYLKYLIFGVEIPVQYSEVPAEILDPVQTWSDPQAYETQASKLVLALLITAKPLPISPMKRSCRERQWS